jgi:hypothetical protein
MEEERWGESDDLPDQNGGNGREKGDAEGGEGVLALGHGDAGDHARSKTGNGDLAGDFSLGGGGGEHGGGSSCRDAKGGS